MFLTPACLLKRKADVHLILSITNSQVIFHHELDPFTHRLCAEDTVRERRFDLEHLREAEIFLWDTPSLLVEKKSELKWIRIKIGDRNVRTIGYSHSILQVSAPCSSGKISSMS